MQSVIRVWRHPWAEEFIKPVLFAFLIVFGFLRPFVVEAYRVDSGSMETTVMTGDRILVNKFVYGIKIPLTDLRLLDVHALERGDIVLFKPPHDPRTFVKRVIGLPGDTVETRGAELFVNGEKVRESEYTQYVYGGTRPNFGPYTVPEGSFFAMGDNRDLSSDSRSWGPASLKNIKGQAFLVYWSEGGAWWEIYKARLGRIGTWLGS